MVNEGYALIFKGGFHQKVKVPLTDWKLTRVPKGKKSGRHRGNILASAAFQNTSSFCREPAAAQKRAGVAAQDGGARLIECESG